MAKRKREWLLGKGGGDEVHPVVSPEVAPQAVSKGRKAGQSTVSPFQQELDRLSAGTSLELSLHRYPHELEGPLIIRQNLILDGKGATIWSRRGPVVSVQCEGAVLRNLRIEVTEDEVGRPELEGVALLVEAGRKVQLDNVELRGSVKGLPGEEGKWDYPHSLPLGRMDHHKEREFLIRLVTPVACALRSGIVGVRVDPEQLQAGRNEVRLLVEATIPKDTLLQGVMYLCTPLVKRRIELTGLVTAPDGSANLPANDQPVLLYHPHDWPLTVASPPPTRHTLVVPAALIDGLKLKINRKGAFNATAYDRVAEALDRGKDDLSGCELIQNVKDFVEGRMAEPEFVRNFNHVFAPPQQPAPPAPKFNPSTAAGTIVTNSIGVKLAYVPSGDFVMGSPENENGRGEDETRHPVKLTRGIYLGVCPVTQKQWSTVMGTSIIQQRDKTDSSGQLAGVGDDYPAYYVSWDEATDFCQKLGQKEGKMYRLPTEAEWEYACRAGVVGLFGGNGRLEDMGWYEGNSAGVVHPVGQKKPNNWGLHDMHGNIWEWCEDRYGSYSSAAVTNPTGPVKGDWRVRRGGSWYDDLVGCRAAFRASNAPDFRDVGVGFRIVLVPS